MNTSFEDKVKANPDSFDDADVPGESKVSEAYISAVMPDYMKAALGARTPPPEAAE